MIHYAWTRSIFCSSKRPSSSERFVWWGTGEPPMAVTEKLIQLPNLRHLDVPVPETRVSSPYSCVPSLETPFIGYAEGNTWLYISEII